MTSASFVGDVQGAFTRLLGQPTSCVSAATKDEDQGHKCESPLEGRFIVLSHVCLRPKQAALPVSREAPPCLTAGDYPKPDIISPLNSYEFGFNRFFCEYFSIQNVNLLSRETHFTAVSAPYMTDGL